MTRSRLRLEVLRTLRDFLDGVGEGFWAEWVQVGIEDGRFPDVTCATAPHDLSALVLGPERTDRIPPHLLPWANAVLGCLRCLALHLDAPRPQGDSAPRDRDWDLLPELRTRCNVCWMHARSGEGDDAIRAAVRRSVERACVDGRFEHLLVLGRLEVGDSPKDDDGVQAD